MTDLRQQVAVTRATELARSGDLDSAAALLTDLSEPAALDLLARIRAQQKRWSEADALWAQVQKTAPDDAAAAAGRKTVAAIRKHRRAARPMLPIVGAVVLVGAVVAGGLVAVGRGTDAPAAEPVVQPTASATPTMDTGAEQRAAELARRLAEMEAQRRASAAALAAELATLQRQAAGPGVQAQRGTSVVRVVFLDGVFTAGTDLSPAGQAALDALGKRLPGMKASITVTGFSVVVPGGSSSGGSRTALLRARVATQQLSTASGLPLTAFTMQSGDQAHPPYRTDAKNRTVTVTLTPLTMR
jgi:type VI secretion system protein ImpK